MCMQQGNLVLRKVTSHRIGTSTSIKKLLPIHVLSFLGTLISNKVQMSSLPELYEVDATNPTIIHPK